MNVANLLLVTVSFVSVSSGKTMSILQKSRITGSFSFSHTRARALTAHMA